MPFAPPTSAPSSWEDNAINLLIQSLSTFFYVLAAAIFIRAILSWFQLDARNSLVSLLDQITEPILGPLRRIIPSFGGLDFTPMIATFALVIIAQQITTLR